MSKSSAPDVVVAGHICLDVIPDLKYTKIKTPGEFFTPGKLVNVAAATISTGGPVSNTGLALVVLGIKTALMGKVGTDPFGKVLGALLSERWKIKTGLITAEGATTSYTIALSPPGHDRMFLHCPGANDTFTANDINYDLVAEAKLFHFGYPPLMQRMYAEGGKELIEIFRRVRKLGVTTSLDMSLPDPQGPGGQADWRGILEKVLPHVDIFLPSAEEILFMLDRKKFDKWRARGEGMIPRFSGDDLHGLSTQLLALGAKVLVIKCGPRGMYLRTASGDRLKEIGRAKPQGKDWGSRELWHPAFAVPCTPMATGSGDSSIAGFLAAYLRGLDPEQCLRYANANGARNVMAPDAISGIIPWPELTAALEKGWKTEPLEVKGTAWKRQGAFWRGPAERGS